MAADSFSLLLLVSTVFILVLTPCLLFYSVLFCFCAPSGAESISVYEDVLRSVRYRLAKGSARFERRFRLSCSEMNGRYTSNELTLEVRGLIIHLTPLGLTERQTYPLYLSVDDLDFLGTEYA